jgi:hypothetical protein
LGISKNGFPLRSEGSKIKGEAPTTVVAVHLISSSVYGLNTGKIRKVKFSSTDGTKCSKTGTPMGGAKREPKHFLVLAGRRSGFYHYW